jgi:hypothetical protein
LPAEILLEPESGGGHFATRREAGADVAGTLGGGAGKPRLFFYALVLAFVFMLGRLAGVPTGSPHRLSGHPSSLAGKLALAKRQVHA